MVRTGLNQRGNTSKEVPTRLIHLVRKRDRRVPSRTEKKEKKNGSGAAVRFIISSHGGPSPEQQHRNCYIRQQLILFCLPIWFPFQIDNMYTKERKNSTSESHYWLTNKCLSPKKKRNRFKYFDPTTGCYFVIFFFQASYRRYRTTLERRERLDVEGVDDPKSIGVNFQIWMRKSEAPRRKEMSIQFVVDCTVERYERWRQTK